jgi:hypothetical protein
MNDGSQRIAAFLFPSLLSFSLPYLPPFILCVTFMFVYHVSLFSSCPDFSFFSDIKRSWNSSHLLGSIFLPRLLALQLLVAVEFLSGSAIHHSGE